MKIHLLLWVFLLIFSLLILIIPKQILAASTLDNTAAYWKLDELIAGSTAADSSGNSNSGTPHGTAGANNLPQPSTNIPSTITFSDPRSLSFDGTDDYLDIGDKSNLFFAGNFSLSAWVYITGGAGTFRSILSDYKADGSVASMELAIDDNNRATFFWTDGNGIIHPAFSVGFTPSQNTWYHLVGVYDGTARTIYVNGVSKGSDSTVQTRTDFGDNTTIGRAGSFNGQYFQGQIDDVRVYDHALTQGEITELASGGPTPTPSPTPSSVPSSSSPEQNNNSGPSNCNDSAPISAPDLFEIDPAGTFVNLYFVGAKNPVTGYNINYGLDQNASQYGDNYKSSDKDWESTRTIYQLSPNTTYYFRVQGVNGCNVGAWSQTLKVKTRGWMTDIVGLINKLNPFAKKPTVPAMAPISITSCSYKVQSGDSLWLIAKRKWGTGTRYLEIMVLNPGLTSLIRPSQTLVLCQ